MGDLYNLLFGEKGNFITNEEGRVIFVGGPGAGDGAVGTSVGQIPFSQMTDEQSEALSAYLGDFSDLINSHLRGSEYNPSAYEMSYFGAANQRELSEKTDSMVYQIDDLIAQSYIDKPTTVYRGFDANTAGLNYINPGDVFSDRAFLSTSTDRRVAVANALGTVPVVMRLNLKAGDNALLAQGPMPESEALLPRGLRLRLLNERERPKIIGGGFEWDVEIVAEKSINTKGNFITKDGKIIFIGGPGSGSGAIGSGGTSVTAANADELAQGMNDTELHDSLSRVKLEAGQLARERETFQQAFDKLSNRNIDEAQARNYVATYPVNVRVGRELEDLGARLTVVKGRIAELGSVYRALNDESVFRMRGGTR